MKQTINKSQFRDAFLNAGRGGQFSYNALGELYDYLESHDEEYDLDVIELCCEYMECSVEDALEMYNLETIEQLQDKTCVVWHDTLNETVLFVQF